MKRIDLCGTWTMEGNGYRCEGTIPGSVYSFLLANGLMEDPFYRDNELQALSLCDYDYTFTRSFSIRKSTHPYILRCEGLDTICDTYVNGTHVAWTDNMHRTYEFDITELLRDGENEISVICHPIDAYMKEYQKTHPCFGWNALSGFGNMRKAQCMMGWDWGPYLPDAGIFRAISILEEDSARLTDVHILQRHEDGRVFVTPVVKTDIPAELRVTVTDPKGTAFTISANEETEIESPMLWWPNELGEQYLYRFHVEVLQNGETVDESEKPIGLRTLRLIREKDKWGESFCHEVNGVRFFAMGTDYIPEDNIFSRINEERTRKLLKIAKDAHNNAIRVWGGGYYPDDFFFDACDEMGIVVFFDMMFACTTSYFDDYLIENVKHELRDNLTRLRHHASIALICGNNEIETMFRHSDRDPFMQMYLRMYEDVMPEIVKEICPEFPYVPSSPSSIGHFIEPNDENYGDNHYWDVWHGDKPFTEYRNHYFRYLSEFGFQSFPCLKTIESFTLPEDRNIFSRVMEMHQRNHAANGKIMNYLSQTYRYPTDFGTLLYASQLLQAESIRYGVEHFRRNRGRCMGALYWQLNDCWPVASWASVDYFGRYKALQYYAKRFFNPVMISCEEIGERTTRPSVIMERTVDYRTAAKLSVSNETLKPVSGIVKWALRTTDGDILECGETVLTVAPQSVETLPEMDFHKTDVDHNYLEYSFIVSGETVSCGTVLFTAPKYFCFRDPELTATVSGNEITITAKHFAKAVEIDSPDSDFVLSDNYFDMAPGTRTLKILEGTPKTLALRSNYDIR